MPRDPSTPRAPRPTAALVAALLTLVAACGGGGDADDTVATATSTSTTAPDDDGGGDDDGDGEAEPPPFRRLDDVTTAEAFGDFGAEGLDRWLEEVPGIADVRITSSVDGAEQPALWLPPEEGEGPRPLLVALHSWSTPYLQHLDIPFARWAEREGWAFLHPDFRGANDDPQATGSDLAVQDVIDAVDFAAAEAEIDEDRVFVVGFSGGGMMSLLMAGRHPDRFAGAVSWVPIHDLVDWYEHNAAQTPEPAYVGQIEASCGGDPSSDPAAADECRRRSPVAHLDAARRAGVPVYVAAGLADTTVPPDHAVRSFDQLADEADRIGPEHAAEFARNRLPDELAGEHAARHFFGDDDPAVLHSRDSGPVTLVLFEGEHDMVYNPGLAWMVQGAPARRGDG